MHIIGIAGQHQNGKNTVADYLRFKLNQERPEVNWRRGSFAKAVKDIFGYAFQKSSDYIEKWKVVSEAPPDLDKPVRQALQFIGDGFRTIRSSVWIDIAMQQPDHKVFEDVRYPNELNAIHMRGGYNILVVRPDRINNDVNGSESKMRLFADYAMDIAASRGGDYGHCYPAGWAYEPGTSPVGWEHLNYVLMNNGSKGELYNHLDESIVPDIGKHDFSQGDE